MIAPVVVRSAPAWTLLQLCRRLARPSPVSASRLASSRNTVQSLRYAHTGGPEWMRDTVKFVERPHRPERPSTRQIARMAWLMAREPFTALGRERLWESARKSPGHFFISIVVITVLATTLGLVGVQTYRYRSSSISTLPRPVAKELRLALYYGTHAPGDDKNQALATEHYRKALNLCAELGLDPLSDEVLGVRIHIAGWMEEREMYEKAIGALEGVLAECLAGFAEAETDLGRREMTEKSTDGNTTSGAGGGDGSFDSGSRAAADPKRVKDDTPTQPSEPSQPEPVQVSTQADLALPALKNGWHRRRRLLFKAVQCSTKLCELYGNERVLEPQKAQASAVWAVETAFREMFRRRREGVKEGEGSWLTAEEVGATLEQLGSQSEVKSQFHISVPLFFHAQRVCRDPCHRAVIMNNLAASLAQHPAYAPFHLVPNAFAVDADQPLPPVPTTRTEFLDAAANWARNALALADGVAADERTAECDAACTVATSNLRDILDMTRQLKGAAAAK